MLCGAASDGSSGLPWLTHLPAVPVMEPSSCLDLASFGGTLQRRSGLPRFFALSVPPPDLRLRVSPSPQVFRLPAMDLRASPNSHPFSATASDAPGFPFASPVSPLDESPSFPGGCIFRLRFGRFLRVAPLLQLPPRRRLVEFRVAPDSAPFGLLTIEGSGRPVSSLPPALPLPRLRVSPFPASAAGR